ncbi:cbb3-type cytochrome c oxidase subunit II [Geomesophilobacter sediminis]|uniref:Cbb3-type cytochrome c oxidase subunit II n=1 Tax=Geomesophilobacter sediminis TaxID=2798584 RepID=A0A8J7JMR4_9BACT|nr:cbb3-type cytochrome c oxidase subunit II [Geomesophilobacter sediminis]MBJ6726095.1 cbb3-type cytochrome c oxidase subunit II [Geomesophilobacter sediminis]
MKMTPGVLIIGALLVFWASAFIIAGLPAATMKEKPSDIWRPLTAEEEAGHRLYVANGCSYCHSLFIRINDWDIGAERIAQAGDYVGQEPIILGSERTGPDLSQEGGEHPDDWHLAHFTNPRYTSPISLMPSWEFLGRQEVRQLTAYVQALGLKAADYRTARQKYWKQQASAAYAAGPDANVEWIHSQVPEVWRRMPNPYPADAAALARGKRMYQDFCVNCHGPIGDGQGPAAAYLYPPPLNFTTLRRHLVENRYIGGIFYYQIMNGITGTAMPYFKKHLESEKIWDLANYLGVYFVGYTDANIEPRGIDAAYEGPWQNPYQPPAKGAK